MCNYGKRVANQGQTAQWKSYGNPLENNQDNQEALLRDTKLQIILSLCNSSAMFITFRKKTKNYCCVETLCGNIGTSDHSVVNLSVHNKTVYLRLRFIRHTIHSQ